MDAVVENEQVLVETLEKPVTETKEVGNNNEISEQGKVCNAKLNPFGDINDKHDKPDKSEIKNEPAGGEIDAIKSVEDEVLEEDEVGEEENAPDEEEDDGDPIPSGTGSVSKDCSASELLGWSEILPRWHAKLSQRPKGLNPLVRNGIPEPLRGEVWQLLSGAHQSADLMDQYRIFLTKSAPTEQIILRDVHRTYPAHENFRTGSSSSLLDSLFKVCKAYPVYDEEVGYCQGLSFLVAALLLHMPEEQAFCVFVRVMRHYGLRDLFRNNFDELYLKFYQLEHLLEDHMPDLHQHFANIGIEPFTYASQWFLTVFTAKFPLNAVFYIMDIFLLDGMNTIFQIALALLGSSKQELLALDFEGVLKYFRVQMPKRYRNQENVQQLIVASSEISLKKLKKHAKNYEIKKQKEKLLENPIARLQRENAKLTENNLRLEQENDDLARDLVASKIQLRAQLDILEDKIEALNRELVNSQEDGRSYLNTISDMEDEKSRLEIEVSQLKEVCRRELHRAETELARDGNIISDYKKICSKLSKRNDGQLENIKKFIETMQDLLQDNSACNEKSCLQLFQSKAEEFLKLLTAEDNVQDDQSGDSPRSSNHSNSPQRKASASSQQSTGQNRPVGAYIRSADSQSTSSEAKLKYLSEHVDELEVELARTKLALVEAECKCQQLTHDLSLGVTVKTPNLAANSAGLSGKLDFMKAAVSNRRSPKAASAAFAKINNLISEKISVMGATNQPSLLNLSQPAHKLSSSTSVHSSLGSVSDRLASTSTSTSLSTSTGTGTSNHNNNSNSTIDGYHDRC